MLLYGKIYFPEEITTMIRPYALKAFEEKINELKVDDDGITPMEDFVCTTTDITLINHHTWVYKLYVFDEIL